MPVGDEAQRYRMRARQCVETARTMSDVQQRLIVLDMAQAWMRLANQAEKNSSADLHDTSTPPKREG